MNELVKDQPYSNQELAKKLPELSAEELQALLNDRFPLERRQKLLAEAPEDSKGCKVRYYRYIDLEFLAILLQKNDLTAYDYFDSSGGGSKDRESLTDSVNMHQLYEVLVKFMVDKSSYKEQDEDIKALHQAMFTEPALFLNNLQNLFPQADAAEITQAFAQPTYESVLPFLEKHLPQIFIARFIQDLYGKSFLGFFSASVGGVISLRLDGLRENNVKQVYLEFVDPELLVIPNPTGFEGEKEVFFRQIKLSQITRVMVLDQQIVDEVIQDETSALGSFYQANKDRAEFKSYQSVNWSMVVERWRWEEKTQDCLPVAKKDE